MTGDTVIEEVRSVTPELVDSLGRLLPQLSSSAPPLSESGVREIIESPSTVLLVARDPQGRLVGSLTLATFRIPTGTRAWIEDVVVDSSERGRGVGAALVRAALEHAVDLGARTVDLTSRPSREAANRLYRKLGFEERETNVYRWTS